MRAHGHSLWLMPEGESGERLAGAIARLARRLGTPAFAPHVTLLGGLAGPETELLHATARLAAGLAPLTIRLGTATGNDAYFRCVVLVAEATPELRAAHEQALAAFGLVPEHGLSPHLSLVYGEPPVEVRGGVVRETGASLAGSFEARAVHVWRTEGEVAEWRLVGSAGLRS